MKKVWIISGIAVLLLIVVVAVAGMLFMRAAGSNTLAIMPEMKMQLSDSYAGGMEMPPPILEPPNGEPYDTTFFENYGVNPFIATEDEAFSTFAMDVDTASYTVGRRWIRDGNLPDKDSVRTEEYINYFSQDYPQSSDTFTIDLEGAESQFGQPNYHLLRVGIKAREVTKAERPAANIIFVVDVSGSMNREDRLQQVKISMKMLADELKEGDKVGLVVYGSQGRKILDLTHDKNRILDAAAELKAEGSTNAEQGLTIAYEMAREGYEEGKINRIILCSDGVANVGRTSAEDILAQIKEDAEAGITLTTLGFGMGNYNDVMMEKLANHGDGNYYYLDSREEAGRLFSDGATSLLYVVASDAKIQVEFNPETVDRYRLLGYENRMLEKEDFEDDTIDAGEVGAGHTVTALYEVRVKDDARASENVATVRVRYLDIESGDIETDEQSVSVSDVDRSFGSGSPHFRLTAAVAEFAEILKESYWAKDSTFDDVLAVAQDAVNDLGSYADDKDTEFIEVVKDAKKLD